MLGVAHKKVNYRGFVISWQEPPTTGSHGWTADVTTDSPYLFSLMGSQGAEVIPARTRDEMIGKSKQYIDRLHWLAKTIYRPSERIIVARPRRS